MIDMYNDLARQTWHKMVDLVGAHTVVILVQRAIWLTQQRYGEASLIELDETGLSFQKLEGANMQTVKAVMEELFTSLIAILTRLVGREITGKLIAEMDRLITVREGA